MSSEEVVHQWQYQGRTITFSWAGDAEVVPARVYALAFTAEGKMLLVGGAPGDSGCWLPGGGIERGETPEAALVRELAEEAAATIRRRPCSFSVRWRPSARLPLIRCGNGVTLS